MKIKIVLLLLGALGACDLRADDEITASPQNTFKIVQAYGSEGWRQTLHFGDGRKRDFVFENVIPWPALYYISPDEHWILRIQKSGSGDNVSYLYRMKSNGSLQRSKDEIGQLAFDFLAKQPDGLPGGMYHTGIEFGSWDLKHNLFNFEIHGSGEKSGTGVDRKLTFDLLTNKIGLPRD